MNNKLSITHNAGFFSCGTIALQEIMKFYNYHGDLPQVERGHQYCYYKALPTDNLIPMLFIDYEESQWAPMDQRQYFMTNEPHEQQFSNYKNLRFNDIKRFTNRYFNPGVLVTNRVYDFKSKYQIDTSKTLAVFHRGNDKIKETTLPTDEEWLEKIFKVWEGAVKSDGMEPDPDMVSHPTLLIIPDSTDFADKCRQALSATVIPYVIIEENHLYPADANACNFMKVPVDERPQHALNFFATVLIASECSELITHSGNGGFWAAVYRGHSEGIHQYLNGKWI